MNLAEVEAYSNGVNVALYKAVSQSSYYFGYSGMSQRLVDGDYTDFISTNNVGKQWCMVDLGQQFAIERIKITNRISGSSQKCRIVGGYVEVTNNISLTGTPEFVSPQFLDANGGKTPCLYGDGGLGRPDAGLPVYDIWTSAASTNYTACGPGKYNPNTGSNTSSACITCPGQQMFHWIETFCVNDSTNFLHQ